MAQDKISKLQEIANRGLQDRLPAGKRAIFDEALRRGIISSPSKQGLAPSPAQVEVKPSFVNQDMPTDESVEAGSSRPVEGRPLTDQIVGAGEAALTMLTGATTGAAGSVIGSAEAAIQDLTGQITQEEAKEKAMQLGAAATYEPRTEAGQEYVKAISKALGVLPPIIGVGPVGKMPQVSALRASLPGKALPSNILENRRKKSTLLKEEIRSGNPNLETLAKVINESGDVVTRRASKKAVKSLGGGDRSKETVSVLERLDPATKRQVVKMLDIIDRGKNEPLFRDQNRPSDIMGESIANRARAIASKNEQAGKRIGAVANRLKSKTVNIQAPVTDFFTTLDDLGVTFKTGDDGWVTPDFSRSKFVGGNQKDMAVLVNDLLKGDIGFKDAHKLKRTIRDNIDYDKLGAGQIKGESQTALKKLSSGIDSVLDSTSAEYKSANEVFAKTIDLKSQFQKMAGKDIDLFDDMSKVAMSNKGRRLSSNAESRAQIMQTLNQTDEVLKSLKVEFKDNIPALNFIVNRLDDLFKLTPDTSMQGVIERGVGATARAFDAPIVSAKDAVKQAFTAKDPDFSAKMKAIRSVLEDQ